MFGTTRRPPSHDTHLSPLPFVSTDVPQPICPPEPPDPHTVDVVAVKGTPMYDIQMIAVLLAVFTKFFAAQACAVRTT